ncbi:hypothetical protein D3C85_1391820 [compost metagenome]
MPACCRGRAGEGGIEGHQGALAAADAAEPHSGRRQRAGGPRLRAQYQYAGAPETGGVQRLALCIHRADAGAGRFGHQVVRGPARQDRGDQRRLHRRPPRAAPEGRLWLSGRLRQGSRRIVPAAGDGPRPGFRHGRCAAGRAARQVEGPVAVRDRRPGAVRGAERADDVQG